MSTGFQPLDVSTILTTNGDLLAKQAGAVARVPVGTVGQILTVAGGLPIWATAPAPGTLITSRLNSDFINTVTPAKITGLDKALSIGTWSFKYVIRYQTSAVTIGIKFSVNFSGTQTSFVARTVMQDTGQTNLNNAQTQIPVLNGSFLNSFSTRTANTTGNMGPTTSADLINADLFTIIEGLLVVTVAGNLELYSASEVAGTTTIKQDSGLILTPIT